MATGQFWGHKKPPPPPSLSPSTQEEMFTYWEHGTRLGQSSVPVPRDRNFKSESVASLNSLNFEHVVRDTPICIVMFYNPADENIQKYQDWFSQAASCTKRENHTYAAVNCAQEEEICSSQGTRATPAYSLYSRGQRLGYFGDYRNMPPEVIRSFVETAPVFPQPRQELPQHYEKHSKERPQSEFQRVDESHYSTFRKWTAPGKRKSHKSQ